MSEQAREQYLKVALVVFGLIFLFGVTLLMRVWPSGWRWMPNQPLYEQMIIGVYATLGIFLLLATRDPARNRSLILFAAWSSLVHAAIMVWQSMHDATQRGHFMGDIPALVLVFIVLLALAPRGETVIVPAAVPSGATGD